MVLFVIALGFYLFYSNYRENFQDENKKTVFIIPSTSRNMNYKDIESCSLMKILYASLKKLDTSKYTFLIGTDDDDEFYNNNVDALKSALPANFHFHSLNNFDKSYVCIVNQLADIAIVEYNADYIYVFADDLEVYDLNFIETDFIPYFKANGDLCLGWGIDENNLNLCTHPFVSKYHVQRLGYFYPSAIKNWYCDNWIQYTYEKLDKIVKTKKNVIKNVIGAGDKKRYDISMVKEEKLNELVSSSVDVLKGIN
jgi:hypothetical protein